MTEQEKERSSKNKTKQKNSSVLAERYSDLRTGLNIYKITLLWQTTEVLTLVLKTHWDLYVRAGNTGTHWLIKLHQISK